jgi:DedD protein
MAFPQFRWPFGGDSHDSDESVSVDILRRRARHRLMGAALLVVIGVVAFPWMFDTQPRPVALDVPITIPDKNQVAPLSLPPVDAQVAAKSDTVAKPEQAVVKPEPLVAESHVALVREGAAKGLAPGEEEVAPATKESKASSKSEPKVESKPEPKPETKPEPKLKSEAKPESKPVAKPAEKTVEKANDKSPSKNDGARAQSLLDGSGKAANASGSRYVVQVAAFSDVAKAHEVRQKLEKAGISTYAQVIDTPEGKRFRVRLGPFTSKAEAEQAAAKVKAHQLTAAVLAL